MVGATAVRSSLTLLMFLGALAPAVASAQEVPAAPVMIAIDTSRSLSAATSAASMALVRQVEAALPPGTPVGFVTFDDEVRWLASSEELSGLRPRGRITVLHDGLVEGIRALSDGGVLVVLSDGQDEGSATTLDDVARLARERDVRVVAVGAGRIDERTLRRLGLLTNGTYAGAQERLDATALAAEVQRLRDEVEGARRAEAARRQPPPPPAPAAVPAPAVVPVRAWPDLGLLALALVAIVAAGLAGFWLARGRGRSRAPADELPETGTAPGLVAPGYGLPVAAAPRQSATPLVDEKLLDGLRAKPVAKPGQLLEISLDDTASFAALPRLDPFERTLVLTEETVLTVREHGHEARAFRLPTRQAVSVGRDSQRNTLAFQDPTLSSQHFRVVLDEEGAAYLIDLDSTNGVYLREERVSSARLRPGDRFRAGLLEFELQVRQQSST